MNIFHTLREHVLRCLIELQNESVLPLGIPMDAVEVSPPRDASHGDVATNAAMVLAGKTSMKPREIAEKLSEKLRAIEGVKQVDIAGPGFINLTFAPSFWLQIIPEILEQGRGYGNSRIGGGRKVNVEYVSANPTGPMHVGHVRGAVYGDALALLLLKAGFNVTKEYYINDAGGQIDKLADSAFYRYREAAGEDVGAVPEGLYPGEYLIPTGESLLQEHGKSLLAKPREEWLPIVRDFTTEDMLNLIREDLAALGIYHDVFTSEKALTASGRIEAGLALLADKGLIYEGVLEAPKGKVIEDWEPRPQTLFKSTQFGDDVDRAIKKSDGTWTYFAPDIAYHYDKYLRGHELLVDIFGADHGGYAKRIKAAVQALSDGKCEVDVKLCQMIKFLRNGEPAKMSKRAGTFVTARDVIDEVGKDVFRFIMLTRKNDAPLDFDFQKVTEQSKDNPVFYVQYAHARARSVMRNISAELPDAAALAESSPRELIQLLDSSSELELIKHMAGWPRLVESAAVAYEPHRIAFYLQELAALFHGLWNKGNDDVGLRFIIKENQKLTAARMVLVKAVTNVIASGLMVLGVEPVGNALMADKNDLDDVNADYTEEEYESSSQQWLSVFVIVLVITGLVGLSIYAYNIGNGSVKEEDTPVIKADNSPMKETPADPGGMQFPHQDKTVYETITNEKPGEKPVAERILPAPDDASAPKNTVAAESWINDKLHPQEEAKAADKAPDATTAPAEDNKPKIVTLVPDDKNAAGFSAVESKPLADDVKKVKVVNVQEEMKKLEQSSAKKEAKTEEKASDIAPAAGAVSPEPAKVEAPVVAKEEAKPEVKEEPKVEAKEEPKAEPKKTVAKAEKTASGGKGKVQLGAYKSEEEAKSTWKKISAKNEDVLSGKSHNIAKADLGAKGVFWRLQVSGFANDAAAKEFCSTLAARKQGCFPVKGN